MTRPGAPQDSYYLSCRLFSPRNVIVSEPVVPSADKSEINFGLQHSLPFPANQPFLDKYCRENHLVLEVWGSNPNVEADEGGRNLVGLATVPLNQIWETFHDESKLLDAKDSDLPLLVFNDWVPVYDVSTGGWQGELRVLLASGFETQIYKLAAALDPGGQVKKTGSGGDHDESVSITEPQKQSPDTHAQVPPAVPKPKFDLIQLEVFVEEGRNLPRIKTSPVGGDVMSGGRSVKRSPNTYVTLPPAYNDNTMVDGHRPRRAPQASKASTNICTLEYRFLPASPLGSPVNKLDMFLLGLLPTNEILTSQTMKGIKF